MLIIPKHIKIVLGSSSPRRKYLLEGLNIPFTIITKETEESFPDHLLGGDVATFLAEKKASVFVDELTPETIVITADTIVCLGNKIINKPATTEEAVEMLKSLSGNTHQVFTGVCIKSMGKSILFCDETKVVFRKISSEEILFYINNYKPFDKAGAYGAQEWIGYMAIERIEGSYFNVMGLPTHLLYQKLLKFITE